MPGDGEGDFEGQFTGAFQDGFGDVGMRADEPLEPIGGDEDGAFVAAFQMRGEGIGQREKGVDGAAL